MKVLVLLVLIGAATAFTPIYTGDVMARPFREKNIVMVCRELGLMKTLEMVEMAKLTSTLAKEGKITSLS